MANNVSFRHPVDRPTTRTISWFYWTWALLVLVPSWAAAQIVTPASITIDPSAACGGGIDAAGDVCITLPDGATCGTVDVLLLFDDTGSFTDYTEATSTVFSTIVADLQTQLPGVDFAFGVGRYEDFGGSETGFSRVENRPFFLNQALLRTSDPQFSVLLADALGVDGEGPGSGGDTPETAIEGLFQAATGVGFNGNPSTGASVRDSGLAGVPATWQNPGESGDVPDFASNQGTQSGELGGAGWRSSSCLRLVIVATDACPVSPFAANQPMPDDVVGTGDTVAASAFSCAGGGRFGPTADDTTGATPAAPAGAATVPETVDALNALGIRVLGLVAPSRAAPSPAGATFSTTASSDPSVFLSALARLTGAVDSFGNPLVFNVTNDPAPIRQAVVDAVTASVSTPIDIALVPDPELDGLTVSASPPVQENIGPGEQACFWVDFEGDASFQGGDFGLTFVDTASNGSLGMTIPTSLECPDCFDLATQNLLCEVTETGFTGSFEWTFILRNRTADPIYHLYFVDLPAGVTIDIVDTLPPPPILPGRPQRVTARIHGASPGQVLDFRVSLHDATLEACCAEPIRLELPECECAQLRTTSNPRCYDRNAGAVPPWRRFAFDLENLDPATLGYLLMAPVSPVDGVTPLPPGELVIEPSVVPLPNPVVTGAETGRIEIALSGPAAKQGDEVCFRISTHDASFDDCCSILQCVRIPDCGFGSVHFEPLGSAELYRSGDSLVVAGLGDSGEDGVAGSFAASSDVDLAIQDFSLSVDVAEGSAVRFAAETPEAEWSALASLVGGRVVVDVEGAAAVAAVTVLRDGHVVASVDGATSLAAVEGRWPTGFVIEENIIGIGSDSVGTKGLITSNNVAGITWAEPVSLSLGDGAVTVDGDEVRFRFAEVATAGGFERMGLTAKGIDALVLKHVDLEPVAGLSRRDPRVLKPGRD